MKITGLLLLLAATAAASTSSGRPPVEKSSRQPYPEQGFWVTESNGGDSTIVRFYANSNYLVSQTNVPGELDITRLSVRKQLNTRLKAALEKDSVSVLQPALYEID